ncbi:hypothetical protein DV737_g543, partial [Chaetothyriales sp. CBS 132003]
MAPKGKQQEPAKKKATVDDKTFGMKNKKGGTAQKQIAQLQAQAKSNKSIEEKRKEALKEQRAREKAAAEQAKAEAAALFKPVQTQKVPFGVDPKTVVCDFFRKGTCEKGKKCKFSHDLEVGRKAVKKDLYADEKDRDAEDKEKDDMANWDEEKLRKVVLSKHGNPRTTTDKVCKYFIQAVEDGKYGWFWACPNGGDKCMYRHSLPPGFILKTKEQRAAEKALMDKSPLKTLTLEDFLESERHKLTGNLTPVTQETFAKWKKERMDKKQAEAEALKAKDATGPMRAETERLRSKKEEERLAKEQGNPLSNNDDSTYSSDDERRKQDGGGGRQHYASNIPHHSPHAPVLSRPQRFFILALAFFPVVGYTVLQLRQQQVQRVPLQSEEGTGSEVN